MTVLVTGGAGFIGGHVVDLLRERGDHVRVLVGPVDDARRLEHAGIEVCPGDLTDPRSLRIALEDVERVIHCAARTGPWGSVADYTKVNVLGTQALVEAAMAAGVTRVLHVSSIAVHGTDVRGRVDEGAPLHAAADPYSRTKVAAEGTLQRLIERRGAPVTIVRPGLVYGPRDTNSFARFAGLIERGRMPIIGSGHNHVPLIHVIDVAQGIVLAAEAPVAEGRAYLLVSEELVTQRDYLDAIADELGVPRPRRHVPYHVALALGAGAEAVGHLFGLKDPPPLMRFGVRQIGGENQFVCQRARTELGFSARVTLREGVAQSVAWYRKQARVPQPATVS